MNLKPFYFACGLLLCIRVCAEEPVLDVQLSISPEQNLLVKQALTVRLQILTDTWFNEEPKVNLPNQQQLVFVPTPIAKEPILKTVNGQNFSGISIEFATFPVTTGEVTLEPFTVTAKIANATNTDAVVWQSNPRKLQVQLPANLNQVDKVIVASAVDIQQQWQPSEAALQVGDALTRTITITAQGTQSMLLPELVMPEIKGASQYLKAPIRSDESMRGELIATWQQQITYVFKNKGRINLPDLTWPTLNTETGTVDKVTLPGIKVVIKSSSFFHGHSTTQSTARVWLKPLLWLAVALAGFTILGVYFKAPILEWLKRQKLKMQQHPSYLYFQLQRQIKTEPAHRVWQIVNNWLSKYPAEITQVVYKSTAWQQLQVSALGQGHWNRGELKQQVKQAYRQSKTLKNQSLSGLRNLYIQ